MDVEEEESGRGGGTANSVTLAWEAARLFVFLFFLRQPPSIYVRLVWILSYHVCVFCSWGLVRGPQKNRPEINTSPAPGLPHLFLVSSSQAAPPPSTSVLAGAPARAERSWGMGDTAKLAPVEQGLALWVR